MIEDLIRKPAQGDAADAELDFGVHFGEALPICLTVATSEASNPRANSGAMSRYQRWHVLMSAATSG